MSSRIEKRAPQLRLKLEGWRSRFVLSMLALGFLVLAGRAFYLQALNTSFLQAKGEARYARVIDLPASRGKVLDRNGEPLAISAAVESICATPDELGDGHFLGAGQFDDRVQRRTQDSLCDSVTA